jgi:hypothetical protein
VTALRGILVVHLPRSGCDAKEMRHPAEEPGAGAVPPRPPPADCSFVDLQGSRKRFVRKAPAGSPEPLPETRARCSGVVSEEAQAVSPPRGRVTGSVQVGRPWMGKAIWLYHGAWRPRW